MSSVIQHIKVPSLLCAELWYCNSTCIFMTALINEDVINERAVLLSSIYLSDKAGSGSCQIAGTASCQIAGTGRPHTNVI